jgi:hypothetical protein
MEQQKTNQERGRKRLRGKTKAILDNQPSKAPGQDQDVREFVGPEAERDTAYDENAQQGVSNRPANQEHAFPESNNPAPDPRTTERATEEPSVPQQQGGNRGNV